MPSHTQSPHGRIKDLPGYSYDDVDYGTMLDVAKGRRFKGFIKLVPGIERMPLNDISKLIQEDYKKQGKKPDYDTKMDLETMLRFGDVHDHWIMMQGYEPVRNFLSDSNDWNGPVALEVRSELKRRLKEYLKQASVKTRRFKAVRSTSERCYEPSYIPENVYKVEMGEAERLDKGKEWMDALRKMIHTGGGKVTLTKEEGGEATITSTHPWGFNFGELKIPKSALRKAWHNVVPMQMVQPWTDANGNPVEPDKMQIQPLRARRDYGEIEAEIAKRMKEASKKESGMNRESKIVDKIAADTWESEIDKLFGFILEANGSMAKAKDLAASLFLSLGDLEEDITETGMYPMMSPAERKEQAAIISDTRKKLYRGNEMIRSAMIESVKAGKAYIDASEKSKGIK